MILINLSPIVSVSLLSIFVDVLLAGVIVVQNRKSVTGTVFVLLNVVTICWISANLLGTYDPAVQDKLFWIRLVMFFALWQAYFFYILALVFPRNTQENFFNRFPYVTVLTAVVSLVTLTPYLFTGIVSIGPNGIPTPKVGFGMAAFAPLALFFVVAGMYRLIKKYRVARGVEKKQVQYLLIGAGIMFGLFLVFNFGLVVLLGVTLPINFSSIFTSIFIIFTSYSIIRYGLFNVKTIATELFVFMLWIFILVRLFVSNSLQDQVANGALLLITVVVGVLLIKSVFREVEQREEIQKLADELAETNKRQESLMHFVSHEVKNMLAKDIGVFSLLQEGEFGALPDTAKGIVTQALTQAEDGSRSVKDILKASNQKTGTVEYKKEPFDLRQSVASLVEKLRPLAEGKGLALSFDAPEGAWPYTGDEGELSDHVFRNLIENAVNYTLAGSVAVSLKKTRDKSLGKEAYIFAVKDTGVGITDEDKQHLFTEGGRGKDSVKVNVHSTGYGLFIAKNITEAHGGTISADSAGPGKGSTFSVSLPIASVAENENVG